MKSKLASVVWVTVVLMIVTMLSAAPALAKKKGDRNASPPPAPTITAEQAIAAAKAALPKLTVGKSYVKTGKRGEKNLEVPLVLDGKIVSKVRLNPATGEILPRGQNVMAHEVLASQAQAMQIVQKALPNLEVASVRLGKQGEWKVDLTLKNAVVAGMNVHGGNGSILPDWKASRDAAMN